MTACHLRDGQLIIRFRLIRPRVAVVRGRRCDRLRRPYIAHGRTVRLYIILQYNKRACVFRGRVTACVDARLFNVYCFRPVKTEPSYYYSRIV